VGYAVFPDSVGHASRAIASEDDVRDVIALLRLDYERITGKHGLPGDVAA